jgi:hypothetical protein
MELSEREKEKESDRTTNVYWKILKNQGGEEKG